MRSANSIALGVGLLLAGCGDPAPDAGGPGTVVADRVYLNGRIYTVDEGQPWAEAFAIEDGRFVAVGSNEAVRAAADDATEVVDLGGAFVMPGIHDMHVHPMDAALNALYQCSFPFTLTIDQIIAKLESCAAETPPGEWIRGGQWAMELMESDTVPHKALLDAVTTEHPIYLGDSTVHGAWLNSKALETLGIDRDTQAPAGGVIVRDDGGEPTGILLDNAAYQVLQDIPAYAPTEYERAIEWAAARMNELGVTSIKDAVADGYTLRAYRALDDAGRLNIRVAASLPWKVPWTEPRETQMENIERRAEFSGEHVNTEFIKMFLDGIPPTRTAAMLEPYLPDEEHGAEFTGKLIHDPEQLAADVVALDAQGLTVKIHATGDRSLRVALDAFEAAREANGDSGLVHEVSHAELIHPDDLGRFEALGVAAEMCPILWYRSPLVDAMEKVIGSERTDRFWPVRSLYDSGALVIYGSDWPSVVPDPSPWPGIEAMITRRDPYGGSADALGPEQAVELATALRIFTRNGAVAAKLDDETGTIEAGKAADFIVLDRDLFAIPPEDIGDTQVLMTVLDGRVVYEADG